MLQVRTIKLFTGTIANKPCDSEADSTPKTITIDGGTYPTDSWTNIPESIVSTVSRKLHLQPTHPISLTRQIIESQFPIPIYEYHNALFPVVSVQQNFDSLNFPADHPGRSRTDTYYVNKDNVLRTHTSAHQVDMFRAKKSLGFLVSADVYRRDSIDRSHYPAFHQMEGARLWCRERVLGGNIAKEVWEDLQKLPSHNLAVEDPNPTTHPERNPLQIPYHKQEEVEAIAAHLKRSLEGVVVEIFSKAREAAIAARQGQALDPEGPLKVRWVEAYFPFTSPSWELEVFWQGDWLEILGCGVIKQDILIKSGVRNRLGWAFGLGLERIAMLLFSIPDIRLFWSHDFRFLSQFSACTPTSITRFTPFSKHPSCYKDVSFWLPSSTTNSAGGLAQGATVHENDIMEVVRDVAGDLVEDVRLVDEFVHPSTGRKSLCYRINYRSLERTLTNREIDGLQVKVRDMLVGKLGVELR
ncbi:MAG: hypothetical protein M1839_000527 [Geoglossum umbratile]|nr:MAG: hypothetical protein M1839_000527 [Geoglossum umbratile]